MTDVVHAEPNKQFGNAFLSQFSSALLPFQALLSVTVMEEEHSLPGCCSLACSQLSCRALFKEVRHTRSLLVSWLHVVIPHQVEVPFSDAVVVAPILSRTIRLLADAAPGKSHKSGWRLDDAAEKFYLGTKLVLPIPLFAERYCSSDPCFRLCSTSIEPRPAALWRQYPRMVLHFSAAPSWYITQCQSVSPTS